MSNRYRSYRMATVLLAIALSTAAWADQSGNTTLVPNTFLNLDTGAVSAAGGDILWNGTSLAPRGRAGLINLGKHGSHAFGLIPARYASAASYSAAPILAHELVVGDIFGVHTNGGRYAKVIVTAANGTSLSLQYTTFRAARSIRAKPAAASAGPVITKLQNNYSYLVPGVPNYGIAPGSLFVIIGTSLSDATPPVLQSSAAPGLPQTLNQTSVSVTVKGATVTPALYYTSATQLAAVLPSTTPVGDGTITVTYAGTASAPAPIHVVASALGLDTLYGSGFGAGVATDANGKVFGLTNSATPGQTIILWGSGIGADTSSDDRTYPQKQNDLTSIPMQVFIGGLSANITYHGRSQYPGVDQINVEIPANVPPGCYVSVVAASGSIVSNTVTLPVNPGGGPCSDPASALDGSKLQAAAGKRGVNSVGVTVGQNISPNGTPGDTNAFVIAASLTGGYYGTGYEYASQGSCMVVPPSQGDFSNAGLTPLDVGSIQESGPSGNVTLGGGGGIYSAPLAGLNFPGTYTFTASGGADVGGFKVAINVQTTLTLTNKAALATITRSQGATVTWSGGFPNGDVQVSGGISAQFATQYGAVRFFCHAPSRAGQFTIPASILMALPPGGGSLAVENFTAPQGVSATGIDVGLAAAVVVFKLNATFK